MRAQKAAELRRGPNTCRCVCLVTRAMPPEPGKFRIWHQPGEPLILSFRNTAAKYYRGAWTRSRPAGKARTPALQPSGSAGCWGAAAAPPDAVPCLRSTDTLPRLRQGAASRAQLFQRLPLPPPRALHVAAPSGSVVQSRFEPWRLSAAGNVTCAKGGGVPCHLVRRRASAALLTPDACRTMHESRSSCYGRLQRLACSTRVAFRGGTEVVPAGRPAALRARVQRHAVQPGLRGTCPWCVARAHAALLSRGSPGSPHVARTR